MARAKSIQCVIWFGLLTEQTFRVKWAYWDVNDYFWSYQTVGKLIFKLLFRQCHTLDMISKISLRNVYVHIPKRIADSAPNAYRIQVSARYCSYWIFVFAFVQNITNRIPAGVNLAPMLCRDEL